jgi:hypothetical protein
MSLIPCPKQEALWELVSISDEISFFQKQKLALHLKFCAPCRNQTQTIKNTWESYFTPEPEIASSLMKIYGRLQNEETLILKGWKLGKFRPQPSATRRFWSEAWWLRMGVVSGLTVAIVALVFPLSSTTVSHTQPAIALSTIPMSAKGIPFPKAQIRVKEDNSVRVHYVRPELLQSMEFETTNVNHIQR